MTWWVAKDRDWHTHTHTPACSVCSKLFSLTVHPSISLCGHWRKIIEVESNKACGVPPSRFDRAERTRRDREAARTSLRGLNISVCRRGHTDRCHNASPFQKFFVFYGWSLGLVCWMGDLLLSFIGCILWTKHRSPFPCFLLFFSHSLTVPLPLAILLACSFLPVQGRWVIFLCYSLGEKRELRQGAVAQLELKALIIVSASISPSVHPSSDQVSALTVLPWWWQRCRQPANALLLFMFPY